MRSRRVSLLVCFLVLTAAGVAAAEDVARATVAINAQVAARTSLRVSSDVLRFDVAGPGATATAVIEFSAGTRTASDENVVLTVEPLRAIAGPGGAADVETTLSVNGDGEGLLPAVVSSTGGTVVGRWQGSGRRTGRLLFALRADASGSYSMPVRFVLSTP